MKRLIQAEVIWLSSYILKQQPLYIKTELSKLKVNQLLKMRRYPSFQEFTVETEGGLIFDIVSTESKDAVFYRLPRFVTHRVEGSGRAEDEFLNFNLKGEPSHFSCRLLSQWSDDRLYFQICFPVQLQPHKFIFLISEHAEGKPYIEGEVEEKVRVCRKSGGSELVLDDHFFKVAIEKDRLSLELEEELFEVPLGYGIWRVNFLVFFHLGEVVFSPTFSNRMLPEMAGILLFSPT